MECAGLHIVFGKVCLDSLGPIGSHPQFRHDGLNGGRSQLLSTGDGVCGPVEFAALVVSLLLICEDTAPFAVKAVMDLFALSGRVRLVEILFGLRD